MRTAVTGGTGFVGSHLVDALLARGDRVAALVRDPRRAPEGVTLVPGGLDDHNAVARAADGAEVVFHVAGLIKAIEPREYFRVNAHGTATVAAACRKAGVQRLVLVSSQAAGGPGWRDRPRTEDDPPHPVSPYGASKLAAEQVALAVKGLEVAVVRPCVVYGPRDRAVFPLFRAASRGIAPRLPGDPRVSLIHVDDLVECLLRASHNPAAAGRTYFACGEAATLNEYVRAIAHGLGRRAIEIPVPPVALVAAGIGADFLSKATRRPRPFGRQKAMEILHTSWWCSGARAERELGFRARIEHGKGLVETAAWYQRERWI